MKKSLLYVVVALIIAGCAAAPSGDTPSSSLPPQPPPDIQSGESLDAKLQKAETLRQYLHDVLAPGDFGGAYTAIPGVDIADTDINDPDVTLVIWAVNRDAVDTALAAYTAETPIIDLRRAKLSLTDKQALCDALFSVAVSEDELLFASLSEREDEVTVNILAENSRREEELIKNVRSIAESLGIHEGCYSFRDLNKKDRIMQA